MQELTIETVRHLYDLASTLTQQLESILEDMEPITSERIVFYRQSPRGPEIITPSQIAAWGVQYPSLPVERCVRQCAEHHNRKPPGKRIINVDRAVRNWLDKQIDYNGDKQPSIHGSSYSDASDVLKEGL